MGIIGMTNSPLTRVTTMMQSSLLTNSLDASLLKMLELQNQISSGNRISNPSDDPVGTDTVLQLDAALRKTEQYTSNANTGSQRLSLAESAMTSISDSLTTAKNLMLQQVGSTATAETRQNAATEIDGLLTSAINSANTKFGNMYLFGGSETQSAPFSLVGDSVVYSGDDNELMVNVSEGITVPISMSGAKAFGALSNGIAGTADLDPIVTADTKLSALNGGEGASAGTIKITDGVDVKYIDLSAARTSATWLTSSTARAAEW